MKLLSITVPCYNSQDYMKKCVLSLLEGGILVDFLIVDDCSNDDTAKLADEYAAKYPEIVKDISDGGHLIGTHSYEHVNLSNLSDAAAIEQVDKTNAAIYDITGKYPEYIRPPYGCWKCNLDYETKMIEVLWDVDPKDWATDNSGVIAKRVIDKVGENDIILLHDASESSVKAAFAIIDELGKDGYTFVTVEEILME